MCFYFISSNITRSKAFHASGRPRKPAWLPSTPKRSQQSNTCRLVNDLMIFNTTDKGGRNFGCKIDLHIRFYKHRYKTCHIKSKDMNAIVMEIYVSRFMGVCWNLSLADFVSFQRTTKVRSQDINMIQTKPLQSESGL